MLSKKKKYQGQVLTSLEANGIYRHNKNGVFLSNSTLLNVHTYSCVRLKRFPKILRGNLLILLRDKSLLIPEKNTIWNQAKHTPFHNSKINID